MKALRIIGAIISPLIIVFGMLDNFLTIPDFNSFASVKFEFWFNILYPASIALAGILGFVAFVFTGRGWFIVSILINLVVIGLFGFRFTETFIYGFNKNFFSYILVIFSFAVAVCSLIGSIINKSTSKVVKVKADSTTFNKNSEMETLNNKVDINVGNFAQAQDVSGNTISERERILKLKEELNGLDFSNITQREETIEKIAKEPTVEELLNDETYENTEELRNAISEEEKELQMQIAELNLLKEINSDQRKAENVNVGVAKSMPKQVVKDEVEPDPYKRTIVPRRKRGQIDEAKYAKPIGNTPEKIGANSAPRQRVHGEVKIEEYKNKVFLGDSDRIWAAMQKQDRSILIKQREAAKKLKEQEKNMQNNNASLSDSSINKTPYDASKVNDISTEITKEVPTIDWDD